MNPLIKGGIALGTIAGVSGIGYGVFHSFNTTTKSETYADKLKGTLLSIEAGQNQTEWTARLKTLQSANPLDLVESLKLVKDKSQVAWTDLQKWCKDNLNNQNKLGKEFQNIERYCTFSVKEKLTKAIDASAQNSDWQKGHDKLKLISDNDLATGLKDIKAKEKGDAANAALKKWCSDTYGKPFKGDENLEFKNASQICVTIS